jgi:hypothetical protein
MAQPLILDGNRVTGKWPSKVECSGSKKPQKCVSGGTERRLPRYGALLSLKRQRFRRYD